MTGGLLTLVKIVLLTGVYFVAGKLGLSLAFLQQSATPVWPPTGISLAALLILGYRVWPGILLGAFLVNITIEGSQPVDRHVAFASSLGIAGGNLLEALLGASLVNRFAGGRWALERAQDFFKLVALAGVLSTTVSATVGVACVHWSGSTGAVGLAEVWTTWWLGDVGGDLVVAPLLLLWSNPPRLQWSGSRWAEATALLAVLVLVALAVFVQPVPEEAQHRAVTFFCAPPLVWAAFRFGPRATATASALLWLIATLATRQKLGPFAGDNLNTALLLLQAFVAVNGVTTIALAIVVAERRKDAEGLRQARDDLELRVAERTEELAGANRELQTQVTDRARAEARVRALLESTPDAMVIVTLDGSIVLVNSQTETLFGHSRDALHGQPIELLMPQRYRDRHHAHRKRYFDEPRLRLMGSGLELRGLRRDGTEFPVEISLSPLEEGGEHLVIATVRDVSERHRLEKAVLDAGELERQRVGHDLHDGLGQQLTGVAMLSKALERRLSSGSRSEAVEAAQIVRLVNEAIAVTRDLARLLVPVELETGDLASALMSLAAATERASGIECIFEGRSPDDAADRSVASQLYRIAQEAVNNAVKHAHARQIRIELDGEDGSIALRVLDDGVGLPQPLPEKPEGMGLRSIRYRADRLRATLSLGPREGGGTIVACVVPEGYGAASK